MSKPAPKTTPPRHPTTGQFVKPAAKTAAPIPITAKIGNTLPGFKPARQGS